MKPRFASVLFFLLLILASGWPAASVSGQAVQLRAAYRGALLPQGTVFAVLQKPTNAHPDSLVQPEFMARTAFPRSRDLLVRLDTLGPGSRTTGGYRKSQPGRRVYFVYARTPDDKLYWSYSALKDALKFDVVETGVMSVAPVDPAARATILATFFKPPAVAKAPAAEAAAPPVAAPEDPAISDVEVVFADSADAFADLAADSAAVDTLAAALPVVPPPQEEAPRPAPTPEPEGVVMPTWFFIMLLLLVAGIIGLLAYLAASYRNELLIRRKETMNLRAQLVTSNFNPDRLGLMEEKLAQADQEREELEQEYQVLQTRYNLLKQEVELLKSTN